MNRGRIMKSVLLLSIILQIWTTKTLSYEFKMNNGKPQLEIQKQDSPSPKKPKLRSNKPSSKSKTNLISNEDMLRQNPNLAPIVELGAILKEFSKTMKMQAKMKKRRTRQKKIRKQNSAKRKLKVDQTQPSKDKTAPVGRKTMFEEMSGGTMGALAGGAALGGLGAMAMAGSAENDETQQKINLAEDEYGIMMISSKVDKDINQWLFTAVEKVKGLRLKGRTIMQNTEIRLSQAFDQIDDIMGNCEAMDKHIQRTFTHA